MIHLGDEYGTPLLETENNSAVQAFKTNRQKTFFKKIEDIFEGTLPGCYDCRNWHLLRTKCFRINSVYNKHFNSRIFSPSLQRKCIRLFKSGSEQFRLRKVTTLFAGKEIGYKICIQLSIIGQMLSYKISE